MVVLQITPRISLDFWFERTSTKAVLFCKKHTDTRSIAECEKYAIVTINNKGELQRNEGVPVGWGFYLTDKRKVKELQ